LFDLISKLSKCCRQKLKAFVPTTKPGEVRSFYKDVLGLELFSEDDYALEFNANGTLLRVIIVHELKPQAFTVLGWNVKDIVSTIRFVIAESRSFAHCLKRRHC
jgi:hypothetical protein